MITANECLLNAVAGGTAVVTGPWLPVYGSRGNYSFQTIVAGTPSAGTVTFEGSNNGVTAGTASLASYVIGTDTSGAIVTVVDKPVAFVRAKIGVITGGSTPTVSAYVAVGG